MLWIDSVLKVVYPSHKLSLGMLINNRCKSRYCEPSTRIQTPTNEFMQHVGLNLDFLRGLTLSGLQGHNDTTLQVQVAIVVNASYIIDGNLLFKLRSAEIQTGPACSYYMT